jgi:uncharacterized membrane protein
MAATVMNRATDLLTAHWLAAILLGVGLALALLLLWTWRRRGSWSLPLLLAASTFALLGLGDLLLAPTDWAGWVVGLSLATLIALVSVVFLTGNWSAPLGYTVGGVLLLGLGATAVEPMTEVLSDAGRFLVSLEPLEPWWLLVLLFVPLIIWLSFRSLTGLGPIRRWVAIGLRCALIVFLALALAEVQARYSSENVTVLFVWDRSYSTPKDLDGRIIEFINAAVEKRGPGHEHDQAGLIVFGRTARLELEPKAVPRFGFKDILSEVDRNYTDIGGAIKLALASFPEGTGKRIVLISDGNENLGNAEEQARIAKVNGVQIDVVPLASGRNYDKEVLIHSVEAPQVTEQDARLRVRVVLRSFNPNLVVGQLTLLEIKGVGKAEKLDEARGKAVIENKVEGIVRLKQGLNTFEFNRKGTSKEESYTYEARFEPLRIEDAKGNKLHTYRAGDDRDQNNKGSAHVVAWGKKRVLLVEPKVEEGKPLEHQLLLERLRAQGKNLQVEFMGAGELPGVPADLAVFLSKYDTIILANVPAEMLTEAQQKVIRSNTHDQGCGLIMIGGPNGFGAGGWQNTELEKALPVTCDLKALKIEGKSGLVLIMHASEMAEGNMWQKKIAKLAIERLSPVDMLGMIYFDWGGFGHKWHIPFQEIGPNKATILQLVDKMSPGDMPDVDPPLNMAREALTNPKHRLGTKHIILISDGDHWTATPPVLAKLRAAKITCTTVCITSHGADEVKKMKKLATDVGDVGERKSSSYHVTDPKQLPAIYMKESRLVSQSFIYDKQPFQPKLHPEMAGGPTEGLPKNLEKLYGFVRTQRRPSELVEVPIETPKVEGYIFPILAHWHYGLGKVVAFTSDAKTVKHDKTRYWDHDWASSESGMYTKFWGQVVDWSLRAVESGRLVMTTELRDGKVKVTVVARDDKGQPVNGLKLRGGVTSPSLRVVENDKAGKESSGQLKFEQKNSGVYEAEFRAEEFGSYFINVQAVELAPVKGPDGKEKLVEQGFDSVRAGVSIPYSPEFADFESNTALLERVRDITGGKSFADDEASLEAAASSGEIFRSVPLRNRSMQPIWYWLIVLTGVGLFFDVAVRRIAIDPHKVAVVLQQTWAQLRGQVIAAPAAPQFLDRLKSRKAAVAENLGKAERRFEGTEIPVSAPPGAGDAPTPPARPAARPDESPRQAEAPGEQGPADYASRLLKAKRRAMEDREKDNES